MEITAVDVMAKYELNDRISLLAGPRIQYTAEGKTGNNMMGSTSLDSSVGYGLIAGIAFELGKNNTRVIASYTTRIEHELEASKTAGLADPTTGDVASSFLRSRTLSS